VISLEPGIPVILKGGHDGPAAQGREVGTPIKLRRGPPPPPLVSLAQTAIHARPELGFRPVCLCVAHESFMMQNHSRRMQRLVTAGLLPERAGQPVKVWAHISFADLMALDGSSALLQEWTARVRAQWAGHRARASAGGSDGGAWLDGDAAEAVACDAAMAPFVTGEVNPAALDDQVRLCVELDRLRHHPHTGPDGTGPDGTGSDGTSAGGTGSGQGASAQDTARAWEALERAIIGKTMNLLMHFQQSFDLRRLHQNSSAVTCEPPTLAPVRAERVSPEHSLGTRRRGRQRAGQR
jgi:hypothetical protein